MVGMNINHESINEQKRAGTAGKFGAKRTSAPTAALKSRTSSVVLTGRTERLSGGTTMHEIAAARDLPEHGVKAGDVGGMVESLTLKDGSPRIADNAWVGPGAGVSEQARVQDGASVTGKVQIVDKAIVRGNARVRGRAFGRYNTVSISGNAVVEDDATVLHGSVTASAVVGGDACVQHGIVHGNAHITGGNIQGESFIDGDVTMTAGTVYGGARIGGTAEVVGDVGGGGHNEGVIGG